MKSWVKDRWEQAGSITIEATISLVTFLLFLLFFLNFAIIFRAQNIVGHGILNAAKGMSVESYWLGGVDDTKIGGMVNAIIGLFADPGDLGDAYTSWGAAGGTASVAKEYFIDSISAEGIEADARLKALGIEGGVSGLDFSGTAVSDGKITVKVAYKIKLFFPFYPLEEVAMEQYASANLWEYKDWKFNGLED